MSDESRRKRSILRSAEQAQGDPEREAELARQGISIGEPEALTREDFLAFLEEADGEGADTPTVDVTVYLDDTPGRDRAEIEDALADALEERGLGEWVGSGQGDIGGRAFFDVTFAVEDPEAAVAFLQEQLRRLGAGSSTRLATSGGKVYGLDGEVPG